MLRDGGAGGGGGGGGCLLLVFLFCFNNMNKVGFSLFSICPVGFKKRDVLHWLMVLANKMKLKWMQFQLCQT